MREELNQWSVGGDSYQEIMVLEQVKKNTNSKLLNRLGKTNNLAIFQTEILELNDYFLTSKGFGEKQIEDHDKDNPNNKDPSIIPSHHNLLKMTWNNFRGDRLFLNKKSFSSLP